MILSAFCAACLIVPATARANGDGDNHQNGSVHHNTTNNVVNEGGQGIGGQGGQGGNGGVAVANGGQGGAAAGGESYSGVEIDAPASTAAVFLTGCQQGAAAQGMGFGAGLGGESRVCQLLRLAAAHQALGMHFEAARLVRQAAAEVNGGAGVADEAPFTVRASRFLRLKVVEPLFGWLPFIGHAA